MSQLKTIFLSSRNIFNSQRLRLFSSNHSSVLWKKMTNDQRISYALHENDPDSPEVAYYKGIGFLRSGREFTDQAVIALKQAIKLSDGNHWAATCKLADIYISLGLEHKALQVYKAGSTSLNTAIKLSNGSALFDRIKDQLTVDSDNHKVEQNTTHSMT